MVRRLLLTVLLAALAVALPVAAEEEPAPSGSSSEPSGECPLMDLQCAAQSCASPEACALLEPATETSGTASCQAADLDLSSNNPSEVVVLDPNNCLREYVRRLLGWPPADYALRIGSPVTSRASVLLPW